jgi:hypothetical protein
MAGAVYSKIFLVSRPLDLQIKENKFLIISTKILP